MTESSDALTDEDYVRMSEEFERREFTEEELERIFATARDTPFPAPEPAAAAG